eukprot:3161986-Alexandrium_andersonii.AAC.1
MGGAGQDPPRMSSYTTCTGTRRHTGWMSPVFGRPWTCGKGSGVWNEQRAGRSGFGGRRVPLPPS